MTRRSTRWRRRAAAGVTAAGLLALTAACNTGSPEATTGTEPTASPTPPSAVTPSGSPTPAPTESLDPEERAIQQAEDALREFYRATDMLGANPNASLARLKQVAVSRELYEQRREFREQRMDRHRQIGRIKIAEMEVTDIDLTNRPKQQPPEIPFVEIDICYDVTDVNVVDESGESVVLPSRRERAKAEFGVVNYDWPDPDGWRVGYSTVMGQPCD
jgi:hypothetical protein